MQRMQKGISKSVDECVLMIYGLALSRNGQVWHVWPIGQAPDQQVAVCGYFKHPGLDCQSRFPLSICEECREMLLIDLTIL